MLFTRNDAELMRHAAETLRKQNSRIQAAEHERDHWQGLTLVSQRAARDVATSWLESIDQEEEVDREALEEMVRRLADAVAYLEEHF